MSENRRVKMTKRLIKEACIDLIAKNPEKKVSVTEICEYADVNRSTFYAHYEDYDALLNELESELIAKVPTLIPEGTPGYLEQNRERLQVFFEFFLDNPSTFMFFSVGQSKRIWESEIADIMFRDFYSADPQGSGFDIYYRYTFCVIGVLGAVRRWLMSKRPIPASTFSAIMFECCHRVLAENAPFSLEVANLSASEK